MDKLLHFDKTAVGMYHLGRIAGFGSALEMPCPIKQHATACGLLLTRAKQDRGGQKVGV